MLLESNWSEDELAQVEAHANGQTHLEPSPQTRPGIGSIGHNNPPKLEETKFAQQIEAIVDSTYTGLQKLILLKIRLRSDHRTLKGAFPSYRTLMTAASVKDERTVKEALRELIDEDKQGNQHGILTRETRRGKSFSYGFSREQLQAVIASHIIRGRERKALPPSSSVPPSSDVPPTFHAAPPSSDVPPPPSSNAPLSRVLSGHIDQEGTSGPVGSGAGAPAQGSSLKSVIWQQGLSYLKRSYNGSVPEQQLRSRVGALIKDYGEGLVLDALAKAEKAEVVDPLDYVTGILRKQATRTAPPTPTRFAR